MTAEQESYAALWMSEMLAPCRELSKGERAAKRQADWEQRIELAARPQQSTEDALVVHKFDAA